MALLWGVVFGAVALTCAGLMVRDSAGEGWDVLPYTAGLAALLLGALARGLLAGPDSAPSPRRGAALGVLVVLLAYLLAWPLATLPLGAAHAAWGSLLLGLLSLILTGWWTLPLGAALGALLARAEPGLPALPSANPMLAVLVFFGLGALLVLFGMIFYSPVYDLPAALDWPLTLGIFLALLVVHAFFLLGRRNAALQLVALCFFLVPTALALSVGGVMTLNGLLDQEEPTHHVARLVDAYRAKSSVGPSRPYPRLQVQSWQPGEPDPWLDVDAELYSSVTPGKSEIGVVTRPGWLGIEWIVDIHAEPEGPPASYPGSP